MKKTKLPATRITRFFERYHKFILKTAIKNRNIKELTTLSGDYVHIDHGIGRFGGLQKIQVENKTQEAIKLVYADNDVCVVFIRCKSKIYR
jgi:transcription-repair coupling factor (superfamily II helicase)